MENEKKERMNEGKSLNQILNEQHLKFDIASAYDLADRGLFTAASAMIYEYAMFHPSAPARLLEHAAGYVNYIEKSKSETS